MLSNVKIIIFHLWIELRNSDCSIWHSLVLKYISQSHVWRNIWFNLYHPTEEPSSTSKIPKLLNFFIRNAVPNISDVLRPQDRCLGTAWRKDVQQEPFFPHKYWLLYINCIFLQCYEHMIPFILARVDSGELVVFSSMPTAQNWWLVSLWISVFEFIIW